MVAVTTELLAYLSLNTLLVGAEAG